MLVGISIYWWLVVAIFAIAIYAVIPRIKTLTIFSIALSF
jgi:hypothetical protein